MQDQYQYMTKTYRGEKAYRRDLAKMSARGWEVVNAETIPIRRGCLTTLFWILLSIVTFGILPLVVWAFMGRPVKIVVQYRRATENTI
jgi:hypothetical protein